QPLPPVSSTDEDLQLQIALTLSKQEHEKEVRAWKGENSLLQKALEENAKSPVESTGTSWGPAADPWVPLPSEDPLTHSSAGQASSSPWNLPPVSSASDPWGIKALPPGVSSTDPWGKQSPPARVTSAADPWGGSTDNSSAPDNSTFDLFAKLPESVDQPEHEAPSSVKANSSGDVDLFGDLIPSTAENGIHSKDIFDIASLGDSLPDSKEKDNKTPETFLGPSASSLVNLDSLVTVPQSVKSRNPFLAGLSAPSPTNPFNVDQPKPTLNQMRTNSPVPSVPMGMPMNSMTYSASLPLPLSSIPSTMTLPASVSAFPQAGAGPFPELPSNLPQPLLPLSGSIPPPLASQSGMNPFL
ncbi:hypothetical protein E2320_015778, partial [Naja naja]